MKSSLVPMSVQGRVTACVFVEENDCLGGTRVWLQHQPASQVDAVFRSYHHVFEWQLSSLDTTTCLMGFSSLAGCLRCCERVGLRLL